MIIYLYANLFQQCQKNAICLFRLIGRTLMSEDYSSELFNELLKRNQKNANAIASFLKTAQRRYAKKMNTRIVHHQSKVKHNQPPFVIKKHQPIMRSLQSKQNSLPKFDEIKQNQFQQSQNYFCSKQRKQQIKNFFQFVRETRETKLKIYNTLNKKNENVSESKPIPRALLHLKNILFFGDGINKLEIRCNKSLKGSMKILSILKFEKSNNSSLHINIEGNA